MSNHLPECRVIVYFGATESDNDFILDDPVHGLLDDAGSLLAGDAGTELTHDGYGMDIQRGRRLETDDFETGTARVQLHNRHGHFTPTSVFDPTGVTRPYSDAELALGKRFELYVNNQVVFAGKVEDWDLVYTESGDARAVLAGADTLAELAASEFAADVAVAAQLPGDRIETLLDTPDVYYPATRDLDAGVSPLAAETVRAGANLLSYLRYVARSDLGRLFASRDGVLTYRDRLSGADVLRATFSDQRTAGTIPFRRVNVVKGGDIFWTRVVVEHLDAGNPAPVVVDSGKRPVRTLTVRTGLESSNAATALGEWLVSAYSDPVARVASIEVLLESLVHEQQAVVCSLDIGDRVDVEWQPTGSNTPTTTFMVVEGISHQMSFAGHAVQLQLTPIGQVGVFILDDPDLGVLDTGGRLAF